MGETEITLVELRGTIFTGDVKNKIDSYQC